MQDMPKDKDKLIYLYCLTSSAPSYDDADVNNMIFSIEHNGLFVMAKYVSDLEFSEENIKKNISDEQWLNKHAREHISMISKIMEKNTVIPFNFGTIYKSNERLIEFLDKNTIALFKVLKYLENKEEWSVKIFCDKNKIVQNISTLSDNIADIEYQIKSSTPGKAYILGKKRDEILENEISKIYNTYSKNLFSALKSYTDEYRLNLILSNDVTGRDEDMIVNATFLIQKQNLIDFIKKTDELVLEYDNIGLYLDVTGPWPPYTFVNLSN
jgi:hypothetical protein